jgi:SAM-dependent methyltransferase
MKETESLKIKKPWPTKAAMEQVYSQKLWGGEEVDFFSGEGSHNPEIVEPYITAVSAFLSSFDQPLSVFDLGCGDFNVGKKLVKFTSKYQAVDIVPALIERNKEKFQSEHLSFHCLDIAMDDLPKADCALVRQVLQHLSNAEVKRVVCKLSDFKYVILTEHLPMDDFEPNKDIISGQGIRLKKQSGIDLLAPPFNLEVLEESALNSVRLPNGKGVIATKLYRLF